MCARQLMNSLVFKRIFCKGNYVDVCGCMWMYDKYVVKYNFFFLVKCVRSACVCVCERRNVHIVWQPNIDIIQSIQNS